MQQQAAGHRRWFLFFGTLFFVDPVPCHSAVRFSGKAVKGTLAEHSLEPTRRWTYCSRLDPGPSHRASHCCRWLSKSWVDS